MRPFSVYPRWRGELAENSQNNAITAGLSPLARGTQQQQYFPQCCQRFIPAGAGNSRPAARQRDTRTVYPRWRGELFPGGNSGCPIVGLSPLARGTRRGIAPARRPESVYPRWRGELCKHNLLLINDFLSQSQSTNFIVSHKQHIHYVKEHLIH